MAKIEYRETILWSNAKALLTEAYRLTLPWSEDGKSLGDDLRITIRQIVGSVPAAFEKSNLSGNIHLQMALRHFGELEAQCEAAETLGFLDCGEKDRILSMATTIETEMRGLYQQSKKHAREMMAKRTMSHSFLDDDDDDD